MGRIGLFVHDKSHEYRVKDIDYSNIDLVLTFQKSLSDLNFLDFWACYPKLNIWLVFHLCA